MVAGIIDHTKVYSHVATRYTCLLAILKCIQLRSYGDDATCGIIYSTFFNWVCIIYFIGRTTIFLLGDLVLLLWNKSVQI